MWLARLSRNSETHTFGPYVVALIKKRNLALRKVHQSGTKVKFAYTRTMFRSWSSQRKFGHIGTFGLLPIDVALRRMWSTSVEDRARKTSNDATNQDFVDHIESLAETRNDNVNSGDSRLMSLAVREIKPKRRKALSFIADANGTLARDMNHQTELFAAHFSQAFAGGTTDDENICRRIPRT